MAKYEYRVFLVDTSIPGVQFVKDVMKMQELGAVLDEESVNLQFPRNATFFLETDEEMEDYITVKYSKLAQEYYTQEDLDNLSIETFRRLMRDNGLKSRNRQDASNEYLSKFGKKEEAPKEDVPLEASETPVEDVVSESQEVDGSDGDQSVVEDSTTSEEVVTTAKRGRKAK